MAKYRTLAVTTKYWRPNEDYLRDIERNLRGKLEGGDFVVVSEKAISTAIGNIVDESKITPSLNARLLARYWMRIVWGFCLSPLCRFGPRLQRRLRAYPVDAGSRHKQVALERAGPLQALMFGSEGGIDGSNLAYSFVSLPLESAQQIADVIRKHLLQVFGRNICVMIVDTDKTYSLGNFHFTSRPRPMKSIFSCGGLVAYAAGRVLKCRKRATPLAISGDVLHAEEALEIAKTANHARGSGAGGTVWDMAERFGVDLASVSWEMLDTVRHKPIVIVRRKR